MVGKIDNIQQRAERIFNNLDAADGEVNKRIEASVWNDFAETAGGNKVKEFIDEKDAMKSIKAYLKRSDSFEQAGITLMSEMLAKEPDNQKKQEKEQDIKDFRNAESTKRRIEAKYMNKVKYCKINDDGSVSFNAASFLNDDEVPNDDKEEYKNAIKRMDKIKQKYPELDMAQESFKEGVREFIRNLNVES